MTCREWRGFRRNSAAPDTSEKGFTVIEMVIALTIMAFGFMTLASVQIGGLKALAASRQRSAFIELAAAEMENLRSLPATLVGVSSSDPQLLDGSAYPGNEHNGHPAVILPATNAEGVPAAVQLVTTSEVKGIVLPYTLRRWVTKDPGQDPAATEQDLRRLEVRIEWSENRRTARNISLTSVWYPGGNGTDPAVNQNPVTAPSVDPPRGSPSTLFTFKANAYDPDADGLTFEWQFGDSTTGTGSTTTHRYNNDGTYNGMLIVTDTRGGRTSTPFTVVVSSDNPTAKFTTEYTGSPPLRINVDATASSDPDGDALTFTWNWGDNTSSGPTTSRTASHDYGTAGTYLVTLTVTDTAGNSATDLKTVTVNAAGCVIKLGSASFSNPPGNATVNDILLDNANKPVNSQFAFSVTTNRSCGTPTWSLQTNTHQRYEVTGSASVDQGLDEKRWTATSTIPGTYRFPLGGQLTAHVTASGASLSFRFSAHV